MFKEIPIIENKEKEPFDFEKWLSLELPKQYMEQVKMLNELGLLEILPEAKDIGIVAINGKEYPVPEMETIEKYFRENKEMFEKKMKQGFTQMEIVPFGLPLERLIKTAEREILKHHKEGKLFSAKKNLKDETEELVPLELHEDCETNPDHAPLYAWEGYKNADIEGKLVYFPKKFDKENHGGKTKLEIIEESGQGFHIDLSEENINIPREHKAETVGGRKQFEAGKSANEYLKEMQTKEEYENEIGTTPEAYLTKLLRTLKEDNQIIDDFQGNGSIALNTGAWFPAVGGVPGADWDRDYRQVDLDRDVPGLLRDDFGVRGLVRVLPKFLIFFL